jgi:hypothetical protein
MRGRVAGHEMTAPGDWRLGDAKTSYESTETGVNASCWIVIWWRRGRVILSESVSYSFLIVLRYV